MNRLARLICVAALLGGCMSTTQTAQYARAPVLFGPVPCVGCAPRAVPAAAASRFTDESKIHHLIITVNQTSTSSYGGVTSKLNEKSAAIADPCRADVVVGDIVASAFGMMGVVFTYDSASVRLAGGQIDVPNGSCDLSIARWPLSAPDGIMWPNPPVSPPSAAPAPEPTPPAEAPVQAPDQGE